MHLFVNNMIDLDISDYELRNNRTAFEELEVSIVDFLSISALKIYNYLNIWIQ
jgi:hypothetical protein